MRKDFVDVSVVAEGDGSVRLRVSARSGDFSGASEAWVGEASLRELATALRAYPFQQPQSLAGGYVGRDGALEEVHVGLAFYPVGLRGQLACRLQVATPLVAGDRPESASKAEFEVATSYAELEAFAKSLAEALRVGKGSARLVGESLT